MSPKKLELSYFSCSYAIFPPSYAIFFYFHSNDILNWVPKNSSCAIFTATLLWNSAGHLLHKTNPDLSYFELSYVFWEHNDSVGRGTTVFNRKTFFKNSDKKNKLWDGDPRPVSNLQHLVLNYLGKFKSDFIKALVSLYTFPPIRIMLCCLTFRSNLIIMTKYYTDSIGWPKCITA